MSSLRVVDLSLPLDSSTQVYPGDPPVDLISHSTLDRDGFNLLAVRMGSQSGTNCDAPFHFLNTGARIDEVELSLFAGTAVIIDTRSIGAREPITADHVAPYAADIGPGTLVVFHTGWTCHYGTSAYLDHPYLSTAACQLLLERGVRSFCLDTMNIDETPAENHPGDGFPVHRLVAEANGVVVENLTNVEKIDFPNPFVVAFPLRLTGADGGPTRAVAIDLGTLRSDCPSKDT